MVSIKKRNCQIVHELVKELEKEARLFEGSIDTKVVTSTSMGNDKFIGIKIVDAIDRVDPDGVLPIKSSSFLDITVDVEEGTEIDRRCISPLFVTNPEKLIAEFENDGEVSVLLMLRSVNLALFFLFLDN